MSDVFTSEKRSEIMSRIRSKWTKPERVVHNHLKGWKIRHKMHPKLPGRPDVFIRESNTVVFIDGCFWHGCRKHSKLPKPRKGYWGPKIAGNAERDRKNRAKLRRSGYMVVAVWECDMKMDFEKSLKRFL